MRFVHHLTPYDSILDDIQPLFSEQKPPKRREWRELVIPNFLEDPNKALWSRSPTSGYGSPLESLVDILTFIRTPWVYTNRGN